MEPITRRCFARIGFLGNPSDGYGGACISISVQNFSATVTLTPSEKLGFVKHPKHDNDEFTSLAHLHHHLHHHGYGGGVRLLQAICKQFYEYTRKHGIDLDHSRNFTLSYDTDVPRQVGLAGSSAIVCAGLSCLMAHYGVAALIPRHVRPSLVLAAEQDLGITAGLQDRVIQVYGGMVYMDFSSVDPVTGAGTYTPLSTSLVPSHLYLVWTDNPSESGKVHSTVKQRWLAGEASVRQGMQQVAACAHEGRAALQAGDGSALAALMDRNFELRRSMFGDDALGATNIRMIEVARSVGAAAKFCGSGGAVVVLCPQGDEQAARLKEAMSKAGFCCEAVQVAAEMQD